MNKIAAILLGLISGTSGCLPGDIDAKQSLDPFPLISEANAQEASPSAVAELTSSGLLENEENTISIYKSRSPSTVFVTQTQIVRSPFSRRPQEISAGSGTGFIWNEEGYIVTNYHVISGARSLRVTLHNQTTYDATLVGGEPRRDIAVLKIDAPDVDLKPIALHPDDESLIVGQKALAIGNPFGLDHTLTVGVISALGREVQVFGQVTIPDMIQTDASINPGNSGGPLLDSRGRLIGMNTQIVSKSGGSAGIGFAVPYQTIRRVAGQIIEHGKVVQAGIGISIVPESFAQQNGINGVIINEVIPGSPAEKAQMKGTSLDQRGYVKDLGDIIVGVAGENVKNYDDLYNILDQHRPGDEVTFVLVDGDDRRELTVELIEL